jgi:methionyl-tRNA formyltransferase
MRILFWGTPDFAVPPLLALLGEGHDVVGVVTQPDRPRGRSRSQLDPSPVKAVALQEGLPVLQPERPRGDVFMSEMAALAPDLSVVVAYGHILSQMVIDAPRLGTLNIHASLLPQLRGAAPIQASILEGHTETGVTIMRMVLALDAGPMLHVVRTPINSDTTYGELHDQLAELGALGIVQALALLEAGASQEIAQDESQATYAAKIDRASASLHFNRDAINVSRIIRAFDPRPGAHTVLHGQSVKCFGVRVMAESDADITDDALRASRPGTIRSIDADGLLVRCGSGAVRISQVQPAGKGRLAPIDWMRGRGVNIGDRFDDSEGTGYLSSHDAGGGI